MTARPCPASWQNIKIVNSVLVVEIIESSEKAQTGNGDHEKSWLFIRENLRYGQP